MVDLGTAAAHCACSFQKSSNPNPNPNRRVYDGRGPRALSRPFSYYPFPRFGATLTPRLGHVDSIGGRLQKRCIGNRLVSVNRRISCCLVSLASPHEVSMHSNIEVEKNMDKLKREGNEVLEEAKISKYFNEGIRKMQEISQKIYGPYTKITTLLANETGIEAPFSLLKYLEKIGCLINVLKEKPGVRDFYIGIPYGIFLVIWGFITFVRTRSISALWFGCYLGYVLINESISSFRSWMRGLSYEKSFFWQVVIATIVFFRALVMHSEGRCLFRVSGPMLCFYLLMSILKDPEVGNAFKEYWAVIQILATGRR